MAALWEVLLVLAALILPLALANWLLGRPHREHAHRLAEHEPHAKIRR